MRSGPFAIYSARIGRRIGPEQAYSFFRSPLSLSSFLFPCGEDEASAAAVLLVFTGDEHPPGMPALLSSHLLRETERSKP